MSCERTLLLGEHVLDQVAHTVAVAKLVVVPADSEQRSEVIITEQDICGKCGIHEWKTTPMRSM